MENLQSTEQGVEVQPAPEARTMRPRQSLPAKGSCWYCDKTLDSVRRFCGKECADAFEEEAAFSAEAINAPD